MHEAAQARISATKMAVKRSKDALHLHAAAGYSRNLPLERMLRGARMPTIGGGTGAGFAHRRRGRFWGYGHAAGAGWVCVRAGVKAGGGVIV